MKSLFDCPIQELPPREAPDLKGWHTSRIKSNYYIKRGLTKDLTVRQLLQSDRYIYTYDMGHGAIENLLSFIVKHAEITPKEE